MKKLWLVVVVVILNALPSYAKAEPEPAKVQIVGEVRVAEQPVPNDPTAVPCEPSHDIRTSDLCAQWKAADAAEAANDTAIRAENSARVGNRVALVAAAFSFIGTIGFLVSLKLARDSTDAAARAAQSAQEMLAAERAWITPEMLVFRAWVWRDEKGEFGKFKYKIRLSWVNSGRSPAIKLRTISAISYPDGELPEYKLDPVGDVGVVLGAGEAAVTASITLNMDKMDEFLGKTRDIALYAACDYEDLYHPGIKRESWYGWRVRCQNSDFVVGKNRILVAFIPIGQQTVI